MLSDAGPSKMGLVGFGVAGPVGSRLFPSAQTEQLIEQAIAGGIRFFDTAPSYGGGAAERRLGNVLWRCDRKKLFISSKAGLTEQGNRDFCPSNIAQSLSRTLERLQQDHLDALFLHGIDPLELTDELFLVLADLRRQKLFSHLGIAGEGAVLDKIITDRQPFDLMMLAMGPQKIGSNAPIAIAARKAGIKVIGIEMLSHTRNPWRLSVHPGDLWHMARFLRRGGQLLSGKNAMNALKWALDFPDVDTVLTSTTRINHLQEWLDCLDERAGSS